VKELESMGSKDQELKQNLEYMMNMGYLNFEINLKLLVRNDNDLVIAINKLCNNMISDSIFEANWSQSSLSTCISKSAFINCLKN